MKNLDKFFRLGMLAMVLVFAMTVVGCEGESESQNPPYIPPQQNPLTGTVSVTSDVTVNNINGAETKTLTADVSALNGNTFTYQWIRGETNISGATQKTYDVTQADHGQTLKVRVRSWDHTGEQIGTIAVGSPTVCAITLKWDPAAGKRDTAIVFERPNGGRWTTSPTFHTGSGQTTVNLTSWIETQFKMRTQYQFLETTFYFKKDNALGSELFDFNSTARTITLTNLIDGFGILTGLFATVE